VFGSCSERYVVTEEEEEEEEEEDDASLLVVDDEDDELCGLTLEDLREEDAFENDNDDVPPLVVAEKEADEEVEEEEEAEDDEQLNDEVGVATVAEELLLGVAVARALLISCGVPNCCNSVLVNHMPHVLHTARGGSASVLRPGVLRAGTRE